jgi:hypothetical protein
MVMQVSFRFRLGPTARLIRVSCQKRGTSPGVPRCIHESTGRVWLGEKSAEHRGALAAPRRRELATGRMTSGQSFLLEPFFATVLPFAGLAKKQTRSGLLPVNP